MEEGLFYDREGNPITDEENMRLRREGGLDYIRVRYDVVGEYRVSTVWLGINHNFYYEGPPLIFETMVFGPTKSDYCQRYATEAEAIVGHEETLFIVKSLETIKWDETRTSEESDGPV